MRRIEQRVPLSERPAAVLERLEGGHWEADLMLFSQPGEVLLVAQERASRLLMVTRHDSKHAAPIAEQLRRNFAAMPAALRQSVTFDNGAEFSQHHRLNVSLDMKTYFCDRHAPWQKGGIENAIGRLRRALPRKTKPARLPQKYLDLVVAGYNQIPRKCLGYRTPAEVFNAQLMHFKCESTPSLRSG